MKKRQSDAGPSFDNIQLVINDMGHMTIRRIWAGVMTGIVSLYKGVPDAGRHINQVVLGWEGATSQRHRYGGTEWRLGRREIGHIHGNWLVDIPFPKKVHDEVVAAGLAEIHHILPDSGWISFYLNSSDDIQTAIDLLRRSFELAAAQQRLRRGKTK